MPDYFQTMGIRLVRGRVFDGFDGRETGAKVTIVNESAVKRYFGGVDPIGRLVKMPMAGDLHIVGVVADIRHDGLEGSASAEASSPSCLMSATTPTMCRSPAMGIFMSLPIGSTPPKYRLTADSFTIVTFAPSRLC